LDEAKRGVAEDAEEDAEGELGGDGRWEMGDWGLGIGVNLLDFTKSYVVGCTLRISC
jgi:hypothetical protein